MPADDEPARAPRPSSHAELTGPIVSLLQTVIIPEIHASQRLIGQLDYLVSEEDRCAAMAAVTQLLRQSRRRLRRIRAAQILPYQGMYALDEALRYALVPADA